MATRTIANGGGNYNAIGTWVEGAIPTAADDVVATVTSGNLVITAGSACRSFNLTGYTGTISGTGALSIGDASGGACTLAGTISGSWTTTFVSTSNNGGTGWPITCNGKAFPGAVTINGAGGKWVCQDNFSCGTATLTVTSGGFFGSTGAGRTITCGTFGLSGSTVRTVDITNCAVNCSNTGTAWNGGLAPSNLTFVSTGSTITCSGAGANFIAGFQTYNIVRMTGTGTAGISNGGTFATFERSNAAAVGVRFTHGQTFTATTWILSGTAGNVVTLDSDLAGSPATLAATAEHTFDYLSVKDSTAPTRNLFKDGTHYTNVSGNTNWAFIDSFITDTETGAGADGGEAQTWTLSDAETGAFVDAGETEFLTFTITDTETGAVADAGEAITETLSDAETGSWADAGAAITASLSDSETGAFVDAVASVAWNVSDAETGSWADAGETLTLIVTSVEVGAFGDGNEFVIISVAPAPTVGGGLPVRAMSTEELLGLVGLGQRQSTVRFDLLDADLNVVDELTVRRDSAPTIANTTTDDIPRTMTGVRIPWDVAADLDVITARVRPVWIIENGVEFNLGVFLFGDAAYHRHTRGRDLTPSSMQDQCYVLNQTDGLVTGYPAGTYVTDALTAEFVGAGVARFEVEPSPVRLSAGIAWAPDVKRLQRMKELCQKVGYLGPYFDNDGVGRCRSAPDLTVAEPTISYVEGGNMNRDSIVEIDDRLSAPNRFIVVGSSPSSSAVVGIYDVPASASWSAQKRGFVVGKTLTVQAVGDSGQAANMARAEAGKSAALTEAVDFDASPDPRHDTFDIVGYLGNTYREVAWSLVLKPEGAHHHSLRRSVNA